MKKAKAAKIKVSTRKEYKGKSFSIPRSKIAKSKKEGETKSVVRNIN